MSATHIFALNKCLRVNSEGLYKCLKNDNVIIAYIGEPSEFENLVLSSLKYRFNILGYDIKMMTLEDLSDEKISSDSNKDLSKKLDKIVLHYYDRRFDNLNIEKRHYKDYFVNNLSNIKNFNKFVDSVNYSYDKKIIERNYRIANSNPDNTNQVDHIINSNMNKTSITSLEKPKIDVLDDLEKYMNAVIRDIKGYSIKRYRISRFINLGMIDPRSFIISIKEWVDVKRYLIRDFYKNIYPTLSFNKFTQNEIDKYKDDKIFLKWCEAKTEFRMVNASMKCLIQTGYLDYKKKTMLAYCLVKKYKLPWQLGDWWFSKYSKDYDEELSVCNWLWCEGTLDSIKNRNINLSKEDEEFINMYP